MITVTMTMKEAWKAFYGSAWSVDNDACIHFANGWDAAQRASK